MIRLVVPGRLEYRDLAIRVVAAACKLAVVGASRHVGNGEREADAGPHAAGGTTWPRHEFDNQVVSAFSEAFNNIAIHGYRDGPPGDVELDIEFGPGWLTIRISDYGRSFDIAGIPVPDFTSLPESGLGIYIIKSFMDEVSYRAGSPNVLSISKNYGGSGRRGAGSGAHVPGGSGTT